MSDTVEDLRRKINSAGDLKSVVRTMKTLAASNIGQYESSIYALVDYYRTVELGLGVCFRESPPPINEKANEQKDETNTRLIVFGSDQGLVGQFNELLADYVIKTLGAFPEKMNVWAVGERIHARLTDAGLPPSEFFAVPNSVNGIAPLIDEIQVKSAIAQDKGKYSRVFVFHNRPLPGGLYTQVNHQLLPLDHSWQENLTRVSWPSKNLPEAVNGAMAVLPLLIREYLFISLFRACSESLASENASRLAAMQRAEKNIDELLEDLDRRFHHLRQSAIDEELFDVVAGFEALTHEKKRFDGEKRLS